MNFEEISEESHKLQNIIHKCECAERLQKNSDFNTVFGKESLQELITNEVKNSLVSDSQLCLLRAQGYAQILNYLESLPAIKETAELSLKLLKDKTYD